MDLSGTQFHLGMEYEVDMDKFKDLCKTFKFCDVCKRNNGNDFK